MPYHDLNLAYSSQSPASAVSNTLAFASELGYSTLALALSINGKIPAILPTISIAEIPNPSRSTILTRLTLTVSDTSQNHRVSHLSSAYDLLALRPTNEKSFQLCCGSLECDLISLDLSQRLPFILKFKTVSSAIQRGIRFEICYSPGVVGGTDARRNLISGATSLIRATRGRAIVLGSEARTALGLRAPHDVMNLVQVWGLGQERGKEAVCEEADRVVRLARLRRESYRGVIRVVESGGLTKPAQVDNKQDLPAAVKDKESSGQPNGLNGIKRKASDAPLHTPAVEDEPVSKREQKRRAKKARIEANNNMNTGTNQKTSVLDNTNSFPIKHEALLASASSKVSKKS